MPAGHLFWLLFNVYVEGWLSTLLRGGGGGRIPASRDNLLKISDPLDPAPDLSTPLSKAALSQEFASVAPESPLRVLIPDSKLFISPVEFSLHESP